MPDPSVLASAVESLRNLTILAEDVDVAWQIRLRSERPRSTVFQVAALPSSGPAVDVFYKVANPPPYGHERRERWERVVRGGLARSPDLERRLATLLEGEDITFARALAVDPDTLTVVTLAVPGEALGKVWRRALPSRTRARTLEILTVAGRAAHLIEECTVEAIEEDPSLSLVIERRLARVRDVLAPSTIEGLGRLLTDLADEMTKTARPMVYCHGDFSSSNVLIEDGRVGLIDFTWPLRQRGFDLAHFAFRLEYDTAAPALFTAPMTEALLEGYGDPGVVEQPGYRFVRLSKLLKVIEESRGGPLWKLSGRRQRAMTEIESSLRA
jgi:aminoglycoside phosphotransferase